MVRVGEEPEVASLSADELRERPKGSAEEERAVSYRRRVLQGRIDLFRAELVRRGEAILCPKQPARVLLGGSAEQGRGDSEGVS